MDETKKNEGETKLIPGAESQMAVFETEVAEYLAPAVRSKVEAWILANLCQRKTVWHSSYGLKHQCEAECGYTTHGQFTVIARDLGFRVEMGEYGNTEGSSNWRIYASRRRQRDGASA
jgi:hypothetical protein